MRYFLIFFLAISASASSLVISATGTFSGSAPVSTFSQPDGSWSLSFDIASDPPATNVSIGNGFDASYSDFVFSVNGSLVTTPVSDIRFFNSAINGLFSICFTTACPGNGIPRNAIVFEGAQAYSGSETSPTILPGVYDTSLAGVVVNNNPVVFAYESSVSISASAPEPSTIVLLGTGLLVVVLARRAMLPLLR